MKYSKVFIINIFLFAIIVMNGNARIEGSSRNAVKRRMIIPTIHVQGSYYDVGYDIGRTFKSQINNNINKIKIINDTYIPIYKTEEGQKIYAETLEVVQTHYPQYVRELQGLADGSEVPFYKLFLLNLDDILPNVYNLKINNGNGEKGCTTYMLNKRNQVMIGHNEDGFKEVLGNVFIAHIRITEVEPNEVFTSYCYAGILPGYAMNFNKYFLFTINIIGAKYMASGKIPRTFAARAMLAANSLEEVENVLRYKGGGVGDAMSINLALFQPKAYPYFYNIEVSPTYPISNQSAYDIIQIFHGKGYFHCNRFLHLDILEEDLLLKSSYRRESTISLLPEPKNKKDILNILGDNSQERYNIYMNQDDAEITTLATGLFDFDDKTWSIYLDNPKKDKPIAIIYF